MKKVLTLALVCSAVALGCATRFEGDAHVPDGPKGCEAKCRSWGLEFVGMVAMGEYSDGCICRKPGAQVSSTDASAAEGAVAGVWMQMERSRQQQASATSAR